MSKKKPRERVYTCRIKLDRQGYVMRSSGCGYPGTYYGRGEAVWEVSQGATSAVVRAPSQAAAKARAKPLLEAQRLRDERAARGEFDTIDSWRLGGTKRRKAGTLR